MSERRRTRHRRGLIRRAFVYATLIIIGALFAGSYAYFGRMVLAKDWRDKDAMLPAAIAIAGAYDGAKVMANSLRVALDTGPIPEVSPLPTLHLRVEDGSLEAMTANLPASAKARYYKARLLYPDGTWRKIKYRLRGRGHWHWQKSKPSLRLKLKKSAPLDLQRHINLINPEDRPMVANLLGEELARTMGLLTHRTDFARLFINGQYRGVYHRSTREDESLLRLRRRLPGPIYEAYDLKPRWRAKDFRRLGGLKDLDGLDPLDQMIEALYLAPGPARYSALWGALSFEHYARFAAFMSLVSGTHGDAFHNHLFYFDPAAGRIEPWITDVNGHGMLLFPNGIDRFLQARVADHQVPLNELITPLRDVALRDPRLHHRRNMILFNTLKESGSVAAQHQRLKAHFARIDGDARADRRKGALDRDFLEPYRLPYGNAQYDAAKRGLYAWIGRRNAFLTKELARTRVRLRLARPGADGRSLLEVSVDGNAAVRFDPAGLGTPVLADRRLGVSPVNPINAPILLYPGLRQDRGKLRRSLRVFRRVPDHALSAGPQRYLLSLENTDRTVLAAAFRHALTGEVVRPEMSSIAALDPAKIDYTNASVHAWRFAAPPHGDLVFGPGTVTLSKDLIVAATQTLRIAAGTTLRLAPGVSIISRGPVHFDGSDTAPIIVEPTVAGRPWGVLAIQGPGSANSFIRHARLRGGSTARTANVTYSGMLSVHHSPNFALADSRVADNAAGDDALHIVNGSFEMSDVSFTRCHADCVDLDYADGTINGISVLGAGNDGMDFMDSRVRVTAADIRRAGDKGLSIGEASVVQIHDARIEGSAIAVAVKDRSRAALRDVELHGNDVGIDLYAKNWRYGGSGSADITSTRFHANRVDVRAAEGSRAVFTGQALPATIAGKGLVHRRGGSGA